MVAKVSHAISRGETGARAVLRIEGSWGKHRAQTFPAAIGNQQHPVQFVTLTRSEIVTNYSS